MGRRFSGRIQGGFGAGSQIMSDPVLMARMSHHFTRFQPVPGTLNVLLPEPFDQRLFTSRLTSAELGGYAEDHLYAHALIEGSIPGIVAQTLHPEGRQPPELVELIADRHLRTALQLDEGGVISFELIGPPRP